MTRRIYSDLHLIIKASVQKKTLYGRNHPMSKAIDKFTYIPFESPLLLVDGKDIKADSNLLYCPQNGMTCPNERSGGIYTAGKLARETLERGILTGGFIMPPMGDAPGGYFPTCMANPLDS